MSRTSKGPVFIVGCPRSGTTLLYHMLLSAGGFAVYRGETRVFDMLVPRFRNLSTRKARERLLNAWIPSPSFRISGLDAAAFRERIMDGCRDGGEFLRIMMESIARQQGMERWAECTPAHVLCLPEIKRQLPDARVVHIIRDGRDVALSLARLGWIRPARWHREHRVLVAGLYWEWTVRKGRKDGRRIAEDYMEVRYEELVRHPAQTLERLGRFVDHDLDYDRVSRVAIGSVSRPNTAFAGEGDGQPFDPVGRWKKCIAEPRLAQLEAVVGDYLEELGYPRRPGAEPARSERARLRLIRATYMAYYSWKHWLKRRTPLGRWLVDLSPLGA